MKIKVSVVIPAVCLAAVLFVGCGKKEENTLSVRQTRTQVVTLPAFHASPPAALAGKTVVPGGRVYVDGLNNSKLATVKVKSEDGFDINGWAFDNKAKSAPEILFIELSPIKGGQRFYAAAERGEREDLAKAFNKPELKKAAYMLKADIKNVSAGEYLINIIQMADGNPIQASTGIKINKMN